MLTLEAAYRINGAEVPRAQFYALACDPTRSVAVQACAGAGKTWMLVARILRALLDGCAAPDILAITFTKKAASEMRDRLHAELRHWAQCSDAALAAELRARGLTEAQAARCLPQARGLQACVTGLGRPVQVRTFHGWFAALLGSAPLAVLQELQLPAPYELLEDDAQASAQVWPRFYAALGAAPGERQDFMDSVAQFGRHQTLEALKKVLQKRVEFGLADAAGVVNRSVQSVAQAFPAVGGLARPELVLLQPGQRSSWLERARALARESNKTPQKAAAAIVEAFALSDEAEQMAPRLALLRKAFLVADEDRMQKNLEKFAAAEQAAADLQMLCAAARQHSAWQHQQRMARLSRVLLRCYAELKRERGWVDMNDVETAARRLLGDVELSGWLQQRLDAQVRHLLIDEFQDTNPLQWQALYGWLSAYAGAGPGAAPRVFLVGDPKQSIYRFRRAEPQVFQAAQAFVVQGLAGALLSCDHTRRCAPAVVRVLNSAMQGAVAAGEYSSDFRAHTTESTEPGAVLALPQLARPSAALRTECLREPPGNMDGAEPVWRDSLCTPRVPPQDSMSALEARQAADWVAAEVAAGRLRADDVMVLSRRRERLGWMHAALLERGIASEQPERLDLCEAAAVQDVVALLDALVSPRHDLSLARALKSPLFGWGDDALAQLAQLVRQRSDAGAASVKPSWWDLLQHFAGLPPDEQTGWLQQPGAEREQAQTQAHEFTATAQRLALYRGWLQSLPPHDALAAVFDHGDVLARFAQSVCASQRKAVLAQLHDLLAQSLAQEGGRYLTPYRLVRALKAGGIKATPSQTPGAVRLLTIHGAKGLQAPTVLLLDTDSGAAKPDTMSVLVDWPAQDAAPRRLVFLASEKTPPACAASVLQLEQQARALEELNALYVALTRAQERLVISSFQPHQRARTASWYQRLQPLATAIDAPSGGTAALPGAAVRPTADDFVLPVLPPCTAAPSGPAAAERASALARSAADDAQTRIGLALHRLLQWHPTPANGFQWTTLHEQGVAREFGLTLSQATEALAMARRMVEGEAAWAWDVAEIDHWGNEVELFFDGELLRLDRLVRCRPGAAGTDSGGTWWVLDFKSAEHPQHQPELRSQMRRYQQAMALAQPGAPLRLAFINPMGRLIEMTAELLVS